MKRTVLILLLTLLLSTPSWALTQWCDNANIVSCWPLEDGSGTVTDESANSNTGTLTGDATAWETTSPAGSFSTSYVSFGGSDDYIDFGTMGDMGTNMDNTATTFVGWIKTSSTANIAMFGLFNTGTATGIQGLLSTSSSGTIDAFVRDDATAQTNCETTAGTSVNNGSWHHVAIVFNTNNTTHKIYVDGAIIGTTADTTSLMSGMANFGYSLVYGGRNNRGTIDAEFIGDMDDIAIFSDEVDSTEINDIVDNGLVQAAAGRTRRFF